MTVFNNNTKNSRDLICDSLQLNGGYKGQVLQSGDNGQLVWSTQQNISSLPFISGVTLQELQLGHAWLKSNGKDESVKLQELIDDTNGALSDIKLSPDALRTFTLESPTGFIFLDSFLKVPSNTSINFNSYIAAGNEFRLQIAGNSSELPPTLSNAPKIISSCPQGSTSITVNANGYNNISSWTSNDYIALRSTSKNKRQDNQILNIVAASSNVYNITLRNATDDFSIASNDGTVRKYVYFTLNSNVSRGDCRVYVTGSGFTDLSVGGYVTIQDKRMAGDIVGSASNIVDYQTSNPFWYSNNKFKQNTRQVIQIDAINGFIHLDSPLSADFDTTNAYMLILKPKENIKVSGLKLFYIQEPTYPRPNNHAVLLDTCVNCEVENIKFSDKWAEIPLVTMYPNMDNLIRIRESYNCHVRDVDLLRSQNSFTDSGAGYGITQYYSSYSTFENIRANGFRHNFLIQGGDHTKLSDCVFRNVLISGLDMHGLGSSDLIAENIYIDFSDGIGAILQDGTNANSTIAGIRVGNSTHPIGDSYNVFNNVTIKGGHSFSNILTYYGVELVAGYNSGYNKFNNLKYINGDTAIAIYDHPRGRLNSNLIQQSNDFNNCAFINCKETLDINGTYNSSNSYAYLGTYANSSTSNSVIIRSTDSIANYNNVFNGWVLTHNTSNYTVSTYSASNKKLTLTTNFFVNPLSNDALILKDSLVESIYPCRDLLLQNSIVESNITQCLINFSINPRIVNNYFSKSGDTTARYMVDIKNSFKGSILNNKLHNSRRFMQMSNCSNLEIISNHLINSQETSVLSDLGSNVSVQWIYNSTTGFTPSYTTSSSSTFLTGNTFLGYKGSPKAPLLTFDNTNGYIGITQEKPLNPLHITATNNLPMCIETTSSSYCGISLQDSNTTNSNMVQIRSSNNSMVLRGSNADTLWVTGGRVGIGKQRTAGRVHLYENTGTTTFLHFDNSNVIANGSNINTQVAGTYYGRVAISIEGVAGTKYLSVFNP